MRGLCVDHVSKEYPGGIRALANICFNVAPGEIVGLIGANGAGKSTTIKICTKLLTEYAGSVTLDGVDIESTALEDFPVAYIPDEPVYFEFMTVGEHLDFVSDMYKNLGFTDKHTLISMFAMEEHLTKTPNQLSKGTKQKLMICIALLRDFKLLIADEPFSGLDPKQIHVLRNLFLDVKASGRSVLLSTHLINLVDTYCDRFVFLNQGCLAGFGSKEDLAHKAQLDTSSTTEDIYLALTL